MALDTCKAAGPCCDQSAQDLRGLRGERDSFLLQGTSWLLAAFLRTSGRDEFTPVPTMVLNQFPQDLFRISLSSSPLRASSKCPSLSGEVGTVRTPQDNS